MNNELVQLSFDKILQTHSYTVVILSGLISFCDLYRSEHRQNPPAALTGVEKQRPLTHDLILHPPQGLRNPHQASCNQRHARHSLLCPLFLEKIEGEITHIVEIDARPSDCITLALMNNVPVYCTKDVLDRTIPVED